MTSIQKKTFAASFLGWTLDAFDFFLVTFVIVRIAGDFHRAIPQVAFAITLTLASRPVGALLFGWLGDRFGRRLPLMYDVVFYSLIEFATAFSPNFTVFLVLRGLYGVAMGGEWGLGAALAMESLPANRRGLFSGILQEGYMVGYLLAAVAYFGVFQFTHWDWRGLFVIGVLPGLLVFYIRSNVPESAAWSAHAKTGQVKTRFILQGMLAKWPLLIYTILLMAAFNFMSHGTQDLYATFLQKQHGFSAGETSSVSIVAAIGAIFGGIFFGWFSQRFGRRIAIVIAGVLALAIVPLWAFSSTLGLLATGAFAMQFMVQGAWGIIPAHLNEISPANARGTFPGLTYQLGNLISANAAAMEATFAATKFGLPGGHADYAKALAVIAAIVIVAVIVLTALGRFVVRERKDEPLAAGDDLLPTVAS